MAEATFPLSIPGPGWDSLNWQPAFDGVARSQMEISTRKRPRVTWVPQDVTCSLYLTAAQRQSLEEFHDVTCGYGALNFLWWDWAQPNDTDKRVVYEWRARPTFATWADIFRADLQLRQLTRFQGTYPLSDDGRALTTNGTIITT